MDIIPVCFVALFFTCEHCKAKISEIALVRNYPDAMLVN